MRRAWGVLWATLALAWPVEVWPRKPPPAPPPPPAPLRLAHLAMPRVDILLRSNAARVTVDLTFTRGTHQGPLEVFVAHGHPGLPASFEAELLVVEEGFLAPPARAHGQRVPTHHVRQAPPEASLVLGSRGAVGQVFHIPEEALLAAFAPSGLAALRLRWTHALSAPPGHPRGVLVRASHPGGPLPLGVVNLHTDEGKLERAAATRCGAGGEAPLALARQRAAEGRRPPALLPADLAGDLCAEAWLVQ